MTFDTDGNGLGVDTIPDFGPSAFLRSRRETPESDVTAMRRVHVGETVVDPEVVSKPPGRRRQMDLRRSFSEREREVLALVAEGLSNRAIASRLTSAGLPQTDRRDHRRHEPSCRHDAPHYVLATMTSDLVVGTIIESSYGRGFR